MNYSDYHVHTTFCDGKNTAEEMVLSAIERGMPELGFSGHAYMKHDDSWCMSVSDTVLYRDEIKRLKEKYGSRIRIFCGLELDITSEKPDDGYDYIIGATHYIQKDGAFLPVDESKEVLCDAVNRYFDGDIYAYCEAYFAQAVEIPVLTGCDIIAHFDLVSKFNEGSGLFDEQHPRYVEAALKALESIAKSNHAVLEINTGAISRGYRTSPYPARFILEEMHRLSMPVILSSDAHSTGSLTGNFTEAEAIAKKYKLQMLRSMSDLKSNCKG